MGKTTLIDRIVRGISGNVSGFSTERYFHSGELIGFYLNSLDKNITPDRFPWIGIKDDNGQWKGVTQTFDSYGVKIIKHCIEQPPDLVIMDELGFFENEAFEFQKAVFDVFDGTIPVLGVLKRVETLFINKVYYRQDVKLFNVTKKNRSYLADYFIKMFNKIIQNQKEGLS